MTKSKVLRENGRDDQPQQSLPESGFGPHQLKGTNLPFSCLTSSADPVFNPPCGGKTHKASVKIQMESIVLLEEYQSILLLDFLFKFPSGGASFCKHLYVVPHPNV